MQTLVLAAGQGTRMRPLTAAQPKPMLPVAGTPLAGHVVETAAAAGASRIVLVVGYQADAVREYFGDEHAGVPVDYAVQSEVSGTADAVRAARDELDSGPFVVLNGDSLYDVESLTAMYEGSPAVGSYRVDDPGQYGVLNTTRADGGASTRSAAASGSSASAPSAIVEGVVEKPDDPPSNLVNTGAYVFPEVARDWLDVGTSERGEYELTDVLDRVCAEYDVRSVPFDDWLDVGRPWELLAATERTLAGLDPVVRGDVSERADLRGPVHVAAGATVDDGVVIEGPVYVDEGASLGPNAYVRGSTYLGPDTHVGHGVEIKNSVLLAGTSVGHLAYVGDSVLGRDVNFGAGTTVANLRHDDEPVRVQVKGESTSTGRRKFGVVVGDGVKTGIDTSLNAGVTLGAGTTTGPGETVVRDR